MLIGLRMLIVEGLPLCFLVKCKKAISWASKRQIAITLSSTRVKYMATTSTTKEAMVETLVV